MGIQVIVNYPQTEEGIELLEKRQAAAIVSVLREILSVEELDQVMNKLKERQMKS